MQYHLITLLFDQALFVKEVIFALNDGAAANAEIIFKKLKAESLTLRGIVLYFNQHSRARWQAR